MTAQVQENTFAAFYLIYIIGFFCNFRLAGETNRVYEDAAMWLLRFFITQLVSFGLHLQLTSNQKTKWGVSLIAKKSYCLNISAGR